jgi:hypothetical protein
MAQLKTEANIKMWAEMMDRGDISGCEFGSVGWDIYIDNFLLDRYRLSKN